MNLSEWNVSKVTDLGWIFAGCPLEMSGDLPQ